MGKYYDQAQLRNHYDFHQVMESAIIDVARIVRDEDPQTPYHAAREAMARVILETTDPKRDAFRARIIAEAVHYDPILSASVVNGKVFPELIPDETVRDGILTIWNDVTLAVWPTIVEDIG